MQRQFEKKKKKLFPMRALFVHLAVNEINKYADFMKRKFLTEYDIVFIKGEICFKLL